MLRRPRSGGTSAFVTGTPCLVFAHTGGRDGPRRARETLHAPGSPATRSRRAP